VSLDSNQEAAALVFRLSSTFPIVDDKTAMFACTNDEPEHCWKLWSAVVKRAKLHWERVELILNGRYNPPAHTHASLSFPHD